MNNRFRITRKDVKKNIFNTVQSKGLKKWSFSNSFFASNLNEHSSSTQQKIPVNVSCKPKTGPFSTLSLPQDIFLIVPLFLVLGCYQSPVVRRMIMFSSSVTGGWGPLRVNIQTVKIINKFRENNSVMVFISPGI